MEVKKAFESVIERLYAFLNLCVFINDIDELSWYKSHGYAYTNYVPIIYAVYFHI